MLRTTLLLVMATLFAVTGCGQGDSSEAAFTAMITAEQYELLSLDPHSPEMPPVDEFHGWKVLGRTSIDDAATRKKLTDALRAVASEGDIVPAACFWPRHGIRLTTAGIVTDFVICFQCSQVEVFEDGKKSVGFLTSDTPQSTFDEVLQAKGVPLPSD